MKTTTPNTSILTRPIYGLVVLESINSNPNGDPDREGAPRLFSNDINWFSPQSIHRKLRDLILNQTPTFLAICEKLGISEKEIKENYNIYVEPTRSAASYAAEYKKDPAAFNDKYVDARWFSQTLLEKGGDFTPKAGGPLRFGVGTSLQPVEIETACGSRAQGMDDSKNAGLAPNSMRFVRYALYTASFAFNPDQAKATSLREKDVELFLALLPFLCNFKSASRSGTEVVQVWTLKKPLTLPLNQATFAAMTAPKFIGENPVLPATSRADYQLRTAEEVNAILAKRCKCGEKVEVELIEL